MLLRSLLSDRHLILEILLMDDGSEDATVDIARDAAQRHDLPLRILPVSFGMAGAARNFGLGKAQGRYVFFIDADDELIPGALTTLAGLLQNNPSAGLAVGTCIRRTAAREDKMKVPHGYTDSCERNVDQYLANELWPIAMGSALFVRSAAADIRFPDAIGLDEDTCFWVQLIARVRVVFTKDPVLVYKLDEARMSHRYSQDPRKTLLGIARAFRSLEQHGILAAALKRRIAWVALRIARQLILDRRYAEAGRMLRLPRSHPKFSSGWTVRRYIARIWVGGLLQRVGLLKPVRRAPVLVGKCGGHRTLVVTVDSAANPVSGADLRNVQNAAALAKAGPVEVVSIRPHDGPPGYPRPGIEFASVGVAGERSKSLKSRRCRVETRIPRACLSRLEERIQAFQPDTILVEGVPLAALLKHLRPLTKQLILDMHNVESDLVLQQQTAGARLDAARIRRLERRAMTIVDRVWVCSGQDRDRLIQRDRPAVPVDVVPNGIPRIERLQAVSNVWKNPAGGDPVLLFVGHLGYRPNVQAAKQLAHEILPRVRETFPAARAVLVGRYPRPDVQVLVECPGVEVHADPPDLAEVYARAHVAVVPLREGGGTRLKILEAMAAGLPVVATPLAAEGLDLVDGEEVFLAESSEALANGVIALCRDPDRRERQTRCAEITARLRFGPEAVAFAVRGGIYCS